LDSFQCNNKIDCCDILHLLINIQYKVLLHLRAELDESATNHSRAHRNKRQEDWYSIGSYWHVWDGVQLPNTVIGGVPW
jgi:hypothetical protein